MRILTLFILLPTCTLMLNAQSIDTVAVNAAKTFNTEAGEKLKEKNFPASYRLLSKARNEIRKIIEQQLTAALPASADVWTLEKNQNAKPSMGMGMVQEGITCVNYYKKPEITDKQTIGTKDTAANKTMAPAMPSPQAMAMNSRITVTISNTNMWIKQTVERAHKPDTNNVVPTSSDEKIKAIKIKGLQAVSRSNINIKNSEVSIAFDDVTVQIIGVMVENPEVLTKIAEAIDYSKIKAVFQE